MILNFLISRKRFIFFCNSCFWIRAAIITTDRREGLICPGCGLNARGRAVLYAAQRISISRAFSRNIKIFGISDGEPLSRSFEIRFAGKYSNFEYHKEPSLDITSPKAGLYQTADLLICSEVLEHVKPPIDLAFHGLYYLLKPGGSLVLSVPHTSSSNAHVEHFPVMQSSELELGENPILKGIDLSGAPVEFTNLTFHGGMGATLEYRIFSEESLRSNLLQAGFVNPQILSNNRIIGCIWEPWSRVWTAQKPNINT